MTAKLNTSILFIQAANLETRSRPHAWHPPTDLYESENGYTVQVEIAGMQDEDFSIQYDHSRLVITGRRQQPNTKCAYHRMEIPSGEFSVIVDLPANVDINSSAAHYEHGFLIIHIPRKEPVNIEITPGESA
jgi:HSP20 family protein